MATPGAGIDRARGGSLLVVEDELKMRRFLRSALESDGHRVQEARTVDDAARAITRLRPDAILLDLGLPGGDGLDLLPRLREASDAPVIVVSGRDRDDDKIAALDAGADDYVTKPFSVGELLARVRATLRRTRARRARGAGDEIVEIGAIRIDPTRREVTIDDRSLHLTPTEFHLLSILAREDGRVVTVERLLKELWPFHDREPYHLRVHMSSLRRKVEAHPAQPRRILTMTGVGYRLIDPR